MDGRVGKEVKEEKRRRAGKEVGGRKEKGKQQGREGKEGRNGRDRREGRKGRQ